MEENNNLTASVIEAEPVVPLRTTLDIIKPNSRRIRPMQDLEREIIQTAIVLCGGNKVQAAKQLQIPRSTFYRHMYRLGIAVKTP